MKNPQAHKKLVKARIALLTEQVFFGTLALRLQLVEDLDPKCKTMWVDGKRLGYNPEFVMQLTPDDCKTVIAHEIGHCIYDHTGRRGERQGKRWNKAGDYVINAMLVNAGFSFSHPMGWLHDPKKFPSTVSADYVYARLPDEPDDGGGGGGGGQQPLCDIRGDEAKRDPAQADEWRVAAASAAIAAQQAGKLPADLLRLVDDLLNPKVDWRTRLRHLITQHAKDNYSWMRPNKMMLGAHGLYMPSMYSERMGPLVAAIDTSGSITQKVLNAFGSEIVAIRNDVKPERLTNIYCDARVNNVDVYETFDEPRFDKLYGGGGTDFRPPFRWVEDDGQRPVAFVYLTDGYGPFPTTPPDYPVIWCMTTDVQPPWGEVVRIDVDN